MRMIKQESENEKKTQSKMTETNYIKNRKRKEKTTIRL
jgi:hypothetical protein